MPDVLVETVRLHHAFAWRGPSTAQQSVRSVPQICSVLRLQAIFQCKRANPVRQAAELGPGSLDCLPVGTSSHIWRSRARQGFTFPALSDSVKWPLEAALPLQPQPERVVWPRRIGLSAMLSLDAKHKRLEEVAAVPQSFREIVPDAACNQSGMLARMPTARVLRLEVRSSFEGFCRQNICQSPEGVEKHCLCNLLSCLNFMSLSKRPGTTPLPVASSSKCAA